MKAGFFLKTDISRRYIEEGGEVSRIENVKPVAFDSM
jgi:hypothetical protein